MTCLNVSVDSRSWRRRKSGPPKPLRRRPRRLLNEPSRPQSRRSSGGGATRNARSVKPNARRRKRRRRARRRNAGSVWRTSGNAKLNANARSANVRRRPRLSARSGKSGSARLVKSARPSLLLNVLPRKQDVSSRRRRSVGVASLRRRRRRRRLKGRKRRRRRLKRRLASVRCSSNSSSAQRQPETMRGGPPHHATLVLQALSRPPADRPRRRRSTSLRCLPSPLLPSCNLPALHPSNPNPVCLWSALNLLPLSLRRCPRICRPKHQSSLRPSVESSLRLCLRGYHSIRDPSSVYPWFRVRPCLRVLRRSRRPQYPVASETATTSTLALVEDWLRLRLSPRRPV